VFPPLVLHCYPTFAPLHYVGDVRVYQADCGSSRQLRFLTTFIRLDIPLYYYPGTVFRSPIFPPARLFSPFLFDDDATLYSVSSPNKRFAFVIDALLTLFTPRRPLFPAKATTMPSTSWRFTYTLLPASLAYEYGPDRFATRGGRNTNAGPWTPSTAGRTAQPPSYEPGAMFVNALQPVPNSAL